ncbi:MAG: site-specific integrase [Gammaproteobacteria bacterium]|nr:site-specific integrase [Gammaproteobacteria bacterium]
MSSSLNRETSSAPGGPGLLTPHRDAFLAELRSLGYAARTVGNYRCAVDWFCARVHARDPASVDIDVELAATRQRKRLIARFIGHLIDAGVAPPPPRSAPPEPGPLDELSLAYGDWLRRQRGLAPKTVSIRQNVLRRFLTLRFDTEPGDLNAITRDDVVAFLDSPNPATGRTGADYKAMCLRSLFGFLFATGRIRRDLTSCVPRVSKPRAGALARHLEPGEVRRLIDAARSCAGTGRRDYAILLLMARLGLRAQEVIAIRLEDIDWRAGEILVRGKGGRHERMPIPVDVGEAIAGYLQGGRTGGARHLFVTAKAPYRPFGSSLAVRRILRQAFEKTGLRPPRGEVRSHLLRHSLAVGMLGRGASLDDIGDVLRHRGRATTTIYARYDVEALRPLARPWPLQGGAR